MRKAMILLLGLVSFSSISAHVNDIDDILYFDRLIDLTFEQIIESFGEPDFFEERPIGFEIPLLGEKEPDYLRYFSCQELIETVIIRYMNWKKGAWITGVWLKQISKNCWRVFHSEEYDSEKIEVG
jgi:hypothetical protein